MCARSRTGLLVLGLVFTSPQVRAQSQPEAEWIDFELYRDLVFLDGEIEGLRTAMLLDSGSNHHGLDVDFAEELGLSLSQPIQTTGAGGAQESWVVGGIDLRVGTLALKNQTVIVLDLSPLEATLGRSLSVILGRPVFLQAAVDLDYPGERIAFRDPATLDYTENHSLLTLYPNRGGTWAVDVVLEEGPLGRFQLDTGSRGTVAAYEGFTTRRHLLEDRRPTSVYQGQGIGGLYHATVGTLSSVRLARFTIEEVPAAFGVGDHGPDEHLDGSLGGAFLKRFRLIMDPALRLLTVIESDSPPPLEKDRAGLTTVLSDGGLLVTFVRPGSPAEAAGWKAGATLVAIDDSAITASFHSTELADWQRRPSGTIVKLRDSLGHESELVLAEYY